MLTALRARKLNVSHNKAISYGACGPILATSCPQLEVRNKKWSSKIVTTAHQFT